METHLIAIRDVSVRRQQTIILDRLSLTIPRSRHTAILGPNGSGKSSLLKLLTRDFYPSFESDGHQGTIEILGQTDWQVHQLRRRMGIITPMLDAEFARGRTGRMTVTEAVASGFTATRLKEFGPEINEPMAVRIQQAIDRAGIGQLAERCVATLSTGERRRTMIARAIVHQPEIFVLDEPTSGLDLAAKAEFLRVIDALSRVSEMTLVLVTHHIDEIPPAVDHVVLLDGGRIAFEGSKSAALDDQRISTLFGVPVTIRRDGNGWYDARLSVQ
jgi:iron complex transport system ATP-binding protein